MGESSTKQLRSSSSSDVIFAGTKELTKRNLCEVEVIFNNSLKKHPLPHENISIKRKFSRDGENNFFINNNKVRQKDVANFFLELGISKSSLLMVNQGKIDSFINMNGYERAKLIEQVAQVALFEERKKESISKLKRVEENLVRLNDILVEKKQTQNILEKSASKAIKYKEVSNELKQHQFLMFNDLKAKYENDLDLKKSEYKTLINKKYEVNEQINSQNLINLNLNEDKKLLNEEITKLNAKIVDLNKVLQETIFKIKEQRLVAQNNVNVVKYKLEQLKINETNLNLNLKSLTSNFETLNLNYKKCLEHEQKIQSTFYNLNLNNSKLKTQIENAKNNLQKLEFEEKNIVNDLNYRDLHKLKSNVFYKPINECLKIQSEYEALIFDILGNNLKNLVTETAKDAKNLLNQIQVQKLSKISILPLDNLKSKYVNNKINLIKNEVGFISLATDVVFPISSNYDVLINYLLTNIIIVDNLENAHKINTKYKNLFTLVTLDFKYIYPSGIFSGGVNKYSLANKIQRLKTIKGLIANLKHDFISNSNMYQENAKKLELTQKTQQENFELIIKYETKIQAKKELLIEQKQSLKNLLIEISETNVELDNLTKLKSSNTLDKEVLSLEKNLSLTTATLKKKQFEFETLEEQIISKNLTKEKLSKKLSDVNTFLPKLSFQIESLETKLEEIYFNLDSFDKNYQCKLKTYDKNLILKLQNQLKQIGSVDFDVILEYEQICEQILELVNNINDVNQACEKINVAIKTLISQSNERFNSYFVKINEHFEKYFKYIFPNGHAKMELETINNVRDIKIKASTKGSAHNVVSLLSGGEKALTIIALLFAILKVSDFSFVILDEIEAALDENNVDKIAKILTDFSKTTQIITITHRRGTMKQSDVLYGISHGIVGVSQAIKIKLGEENEFSKEII